MPGPGQPETAPLTEGQLRALRNLAEKRAGTVTAFLNIADAQALTELGLARRSQQGWDLTAAGAAHLARLRAHPDPSEGET